ncbi:ribonuclease HIII [Bacillus songklensis]|uniref:Ribonuclease HIII n=1 Tax=Bacillus songklensis TaxID=1069116 RepID=A0ABV8B0H1_9BACI
MSNTVLKVDAGQLEKMRHYYQTKLTDKIPQGGLFTAKTTGCTITAYRSGKVLFQGKEAAKEAAKWGNGDSQKSSPSSSASRKQVSSLPDNIGRQSFIGSDEVGTGDYFGPITVVAAYVDKKQIPLLQELGVRDSKSLTDEKIINIAKQLTAFLPYSLLVLHNNKYNELQQKGMSQGKMKAILHNQAIGHVLRKIEPEKPEGILIDQFVESAIYYKHIAAQKQIVRENVYFSTKGESVHIAVAAASMIARYAFLKEMDKLSKQAGFTLPKGAGTQVDVAAARLIKSKGEQSLPLFTKLHFANTQKAMKIAQK